MLSRRVGEALLALLPELCPLFPSPTHHRAPTLGKTVFLKTGPWGEKDWGPLCYCIYGLIQGGGEEATHSLRGPMNLMVCSRGRLPLSFLRPISLHPAMENRARNRVDVQRSCVILNLSSVQHLARLACVLTCNLWLCSGV